MNNEAFCTVDQANSDVDTVWLNVVGGGSVCIKRTDEGIVIDVLPQNGDPVASTYAFWNELHDLS